MPTVDKEKLSDAFDIEYIEEEVKSISSNISGSNDPNDILFDNIDRANNILDEIESEINRGNISARMAEVAGQLINSVTNATAQIMTDKYNMKYLKLRENIVKLKEYEVKLKSKGLGAPRSRELIIATREDVLKILKDKEVKQINDAMMQ